MKNEEKALNLSGLKETPDYEERYYNSINCLVYDKCLEMARWKDEQFEMGIKRVEKKVIELFGQKLLDDFKQAMMEE